MNNTKHKQLSSNKELTWRFVAFKNTNDYNESKPYFERIFNSHAELKVFSARHSALEKPLHPDYVSTYHHL